MKTSQAQNIRNCKSSFRSSANSFGNGANSFESSTELCGALIETTTPGTMKDQISANANLMSYLIFKIHQSHNLFEDFEEEEAILESMEAAAGIAA